jgi:hypothetical protein
MMQQNRNERAEGREKEIRRGKEKYTGTTKEKRKKERKKERKRERTSTELACSSETLESHIQPEYGSRMFTEVLISFLYSEKGGSISNEVPIYHFDNKVEGREFLGSTLKMEAACSSKMS